MAELEAAYLSGDERLIALQDGDSIYAPWGNRNRKSIERHVADLLGPNLQKVKVWYRLELKEGFEGDDVPDGAVMHKLWIMPGDGPVGWNTPENGGWRPDPVTSLPASQE